MIAARSNGWHITPLSTQGAQQTRARNSFFQSAIRASTIPPIAIAPWCPDSEIVIVIGARTSSSSNAYDAAFGDYEAVISHLWLKDWPPVRLTLHDVAGIPAAWRRTFFEEKGF